MKLAVDVTYQGCAEIGLCYPPITKTLTSRCPRRAAAAGDGCAAAAGDQPKFLNPDQAFQASATRGRTGQRPHSTGRSRTGYYLYRSRIKVKTDSAVQLGALALPRGQEPDG